MFEDICKIYKNFMNEDFAPFELAVKLREKGFNEPCYGYYHCNGGDDSFELCGNGDRDFLNSKNKHRIAAPTISQVLKWLREEKGMEVYSNYNRIYKHWTYIARAFDDSCYNGVGGFKSYELAALAGIEYVLDKMI